MASTLIDRLTSIIETGEISRSGLARAAGLHPNSLRKLGSPDWNPTADTLGLLPSASLDASDKGLYEPIHGSAPDIAGLGKANPLATILSAAMMLRYSLEHEKAADRIEAAIARALAGGARTSDLGGSYSTREMADAVLSFL